MPPVVLVVPGRLDVRTGGSIYDRRIVEGLRQRGWFVEVLELDASFPYPTSASLAHADRALAAVRAGTIVIVDSLALGAMPDLITREASRLRIVALALTRELIVVLQAGVARGLRFGLLLII